MRWEKPVGNNLPEGIGFATAADVEAVAGAMRAEHIREIRVALFRDAAGALRRAWADASVCVAGRREGRALFVAGVGQVSPLTNAAVGWLMGTPEMDAHGVWIASRTRDALPVLHRLADVGRIENWIPADYRPARKWLAWLGFTEGADVDVNGVRHVHVWHDAEAGA